jgi:hypothetical protein
MFTDHDINSGNDKSFDYLTKPYLGTIMDPNDPNYEGRCKILVHGVYDGLSTDDLPWANPATKSTYFGTTGSASISIPKKDTLVVVYFNHGDIYSPEYFQIQELAPDLQSQLKADTGDYLNSHYIMWDGDVYLRIYFTKKTGMMIDYQNSQINIKPDKSIIIQNASRKGIVEMIDDGTMNITQDNNINIKCNAVTNLTVTKDINVKTSAKLNIESTNETTIKCSKLIVDHAETIELGKGATEHVILGDKFMTLFNSHSHIGNAGAPVSKPITPMTMGELSQMKVVVK